MNALRTDAVHHGIDGLVAASVADLADLPPTVTRVLVAPDGAVPESLGDIDLVLLAGPGPDQELAGLAELHVGVEFGRWIDVTDAESLDAACRTARSTQWTVVNFADPTKIPLEIVLAAADESKGSIITTVADPVEARVVFGVLERGSDGVLMPATAVGDAAALAAAALPLTRDLDLVTLAVTAVTRVGMGERACVDTCSLLRPDEGILVGSRATGLLLCVSETHPLPYMDTRPFRVNAGALMSYTLGDHERTRYLSELRAGATVLAVDAQGHTRTVTVGRVKIERRPLLAIDAVAPDGRTANLILQDDWHVRVLGPGGVVLNSTALVPGDQVLGYLPSRARHVGYGIDELCREQ
jgi:3-amino-4-hydroxybenzoic acid synthase